MKRTATSLEDAFLALHQRLVGTLRAEAESLGFTLSQLEVLRFVVEEGSPTMSQIAARLHVTAPSATSLVEHLFARKLVVRKADPRDRRGVRVSATAKTRGLFASFASLKKSALHDLLEPLSIDDRAHLTRIFTKLT